MLNVAKQLLKVCNSSNENQTLGKYPNVRRFLNDSSSIEDVCRQINRSDLYDNLKDLKEVEHGDDDDDKNEEEMKRHVMRMFRMRRLFKPFMKLENFPRNLHRVRFRIFKGLLLTLSWGTSCIYVAWTYLPPIAS